MADISKFLNSYIASFSRITNTAHFHGVVALPKMQEIRAMEESLMEVFFPGRVRDCNDCTLEEAVALELDRFTSLLEESIYLAYQYENRDKSLTSDELHALTDKAVEGLLEDLPNIRKLLKKDAAAGFAGDPAARSVHEVIICYPAIRALASHRVAHRLFLLGVPLIPRMMSESVHRDTGIDIHPGASIGESFFIDHGTGVVIGETTIIGNNVKLYQGVTLGALSFPKDSCGQLLKGAKRHPTIGNNVTIYANATILGDIEIGDNSTIGSSAWIKSDISAYSLVTIPDPDIIIKQRIPAQDRNTKYAWLDFSML